MGESSSFCVSEITASEITVVLFRALKLILFRPILIKSIYTLYHTYNVSDIYPDNEDKHDSSARVVRTKFYI